MILKTWKALMKVHSRLRMPSDRFSSLTRRITRKSRKKVMDTDAFSEACGWKDNFLKEAKHKITTFSKVKRTLTYRNFLHRIRLLCKDEVLILFNTLKQSTLNFYFHQGFKSDWKIKESYMYDVLKS